MVASYLKHRLTVLILNWKISAGISEQNSNTFNQRAAGKLDVTGEAHKGLVRLRLNVDTLA